MLNAISLKNRLQELSDLRDRGCFASRWETELREMRRLGYKDPESMVIAWRQENGKPPMPDFVK